MATQRRRRRSPDDQKYGLDYARFSTKHQDSIEDQQATNRETADEFDVTIVDSFVDRGVSRTIAEREGLMAMFAHLRAHPEVGYIIVPELERLTAGVEQRADIKRLCQQLGVIILTEDTGEIDPYNDEQMHAADKRAVESDGEVIKVKRRVRRHLRQKALSGVMLKRPPYGVRVKALIGPDGEELPAGAKLIDARGRVIRSGEAELHPAEIFWLRKIFEWAADGKKPSEIRDLLNGKGIPTKTGKERWAVRTIEGIVTNPFFKGELVWGRRENVQIGDKTVQMPREEGDRNIVTIDSPLGEIVPILTWEKANQTFADYVGKRGTKKRSYPPQLLDSFIHCGRCGYRMYGRSDGHKMPTDPGVFTWRYCCFGTGGKHYANRVEPEPGFGDCPRPWTISMKKVLAQLALLGTEQATVTARQLGGAENAQLRTKRLEKALDTAKARRARIAENFEDGDITREQKRERQAEVDAQIAELVAEVTASRGAARTATLAVADSSAWGRLVELLQDEALPVALRVDALRTRAGVHRIYVDGPQVTVELVDGDTGGEGNLLRLEYGDSLMHAS